MSTLYIPSDERELTEREKTILQAIVQMFVLHASPVGSRSISKYLEKNTRLSAASIRNVMSDLEALGYITHPHTSAGRMPTDKGYRMYVDALMELDKYPIEEHQIFGALAMSSRDTVLRDASKILGALSHHLAIVKLPQFEDILVNRVEMFPLSSDRVLIVVALESDIVRTVTVESTHVPDTNTVHDVTRFINERLSGKPLRSLPEIFPEIRAELDEAPSLVRLFVEHVERLPAISTGATVHVAGVPQLLAQPEFDNPERMRSVIELMENEEVIIHLIDSAGGDEGVSVKIGNELEHDELQQYSLVATTYRIGSTRGSIGVIGPKRMQYSRMMSLVQLVSNALTTTLKTEKLND